MSHRPPVLLLSGSVRAGSSNRLLLDAGASIAPKSLEVAYGPSPGALPHFDPDLDSDSLLPTPIRTLRETIGHSSALVISCPEYAHGIPGSFKNMLDWLVGSTTFAGMPLALWNASPRSVHVGPQLREVLATMAARVIEPACLELAVSGRFSEAAELVSDGEARSRIAVAWAELERACVAEPSVTV